MKKKANRRVTRTQRKVNIYVHIWSEIEYPTKIRAPGLDCANVAWVTENYRVHL